MRSSLPLVLPLILPLVVVSACGPSEPSEGDIYENLLTGERIEIEAVGSCGAMARLREAVVERMAEIWMEANGVELEPFELDQLVGITHLHSSADSLNGECYAYDSNVRTQGITVRFYNIAPLYELGESRMRRLN